MQFHRSLLVSLALAGLASTGAADVVDSTLSPAGTYALTGSTSLGLSSRRAVKITASSVHRLDAIEVGARGYASLFGVLPKARALLCVDAGGVPGAVIEDLGLQQVPGVSTGVELVTFASVQRPWLQAGADYWVVLESNDGGLITWMHNSEGFLGRADCLLGLLSNWLPWALEATATAPAVRVTGTVALPEIAFTNLAGLPLAYAPGAGFPIEVTGSVEVHQGAAFVLTHDTLIEQVRIALVNTNPLLAAAVEVSLHADAGGVPGAAVAELGIVTSLPGLGLGGAPVALTPALQTKLAAGTYWLLCSPLGTLSQAQWAKALVSVPGLRVEGSVGGGWITIAADLPAFEILGHPEDEVESYCTAGTSASGCLAKLYSTGDPSASAASGFTVTASAFEGKKIGIFFYGANGRQAMSWGNGSSFQCVVPPVTRAVLNEGSGVAGTCDGFTSRDLNALWSTRPNKNPGEGAVVQLQFWYRDPKNTSNQTTSLSDALEFTVQP